MFPDDPRGLLNIQGLGHFTYLVNINNLHWDKSIANLENGNYILLVSLFIDDPHSPQNIIDSNSLSYIK